MIIFINIAIMFASFSCTGWKSLIGLVSCDETRQAPGRGGKWFLFFVFPPSTQEAA